MTSECGLRLERALVADEAGEDLVPYLHLVLGCDVIGEDAILTRESEHLLVVTQCAAVTVVSCSRAVLLDMLGQRSGRSEP